MSGKLDGLVILRYAHIKRHRISGGMEQYLRQLDDNLLSHHKITILQTHLVDFHESDEPQEESRGLGKIVWIPIRSTTISTRISSLPKRLQLLASATRNLRGPNNTLPRSTQFLTAPFRHLRYPAIILSDSLLGYVAAFDVKLIVFHWLSYDIGPLIAEARKCQVPYVVIHHFDNSRLNQRAFRAWVQSATLVGGVSARNLPSSLQDRFSNLSDAVDTIFYSPGEYGAKPSVSHPVILLAARVTEGKGHLDALQAAHVLLKKGIKISLVFAGVVESEEFRRRLEVTAHSLYLGEQVTYLGQQTSVELRDWYSVADIVVLPSSAEGLGKVLLEAQAMGKPVIGYDTGGIPDAMIDGITGFLAPLGDYEALSSKIQLLLADPVRRQSMGNAGRDFVTKHFSVAALTRNHQDFYLRALAVHR